MTPRGFKGLAFALFELAVLGGAGCRGKSEPVPSSPQAMADDDLPSACKAYAAALRQCMASPAFPAAQREPERSALEQMLASLGLRGVPQAERPVAREAAAQNCLASLNTLRESGKTSCPGAF